MFQIVGTRHAGGGLADLLDGGQQQADQDGDDRNHHQEFNEGEPLAVGLLHGRGSLWVCGYLASRLIAASSLRVDEHQHVLRLGLLVVGAGRGAGGGGRGDPDTE